MRCRAAIGGHMYVINVGAYMASAATSASDSGFIRFNAFMTDHACRRHGHVEMPPLVR